MPLFLMLIGYGLDWLMNIRFWPVPVFLFLFCAKRVYDHSMINMFWNRIETEEITDAMQFVLQHGIHSGEKLYIHNGARPAFIYYTQIHPGKKRFSQIENAHLLSWDANYVAITKEARDTIGFIMSSLEPEKLEWTKKVFQDRMEEITRMEKQGCHALIFKSRQK